MLTLPNIPNEPDAQKAIARCYKEKQHVTRLSPNTYRVTNRAKNHSYLVTLDMDMGEGRCTCAATKLCKHLIAALTLEYAIQEMRSYAATSEWPEYIETTDEPSETNVMSEPQTLETPAPARATTLTRQQLLEGAHARLATRLGHEPAEEPVPAPPLTPAQEKRERSRAEDHRRDTSYLGFVPEDDEAEYMEGIML